MLITHDLGIVSQTANRVMVMYMGKIGEMAGVHDLFGSPLHPYTKGLLKSLPNFYKDLVKKERLEEISGVVGNLINPPKGCYFWPRCALRRKHVPAGGPQFRGSFRPGHSVRCWMAGKGHSLSETPLGLRT